MNYFRAGILFFLAVFLLASQNSLAQTNLPSKEEISGDVYFRLGPSGMPVYPRGGSNNEHWEAGLNLDLKYKKMEFSIAPSIIGAATFDNPDRFQFTVGVSRKLPRRFLVETVLFDAYALNNIPPIDPKARRPTSGVNSLWLGGRWDFEKYQNHVSLFARYAINSNEPVLFTHFTKPYARWHLGAVSKSKLTDKTFFLFEPAVYISNKISVARAALNLGVERQIRGVIVGGYYTAYRNLGVPGGTTDFRHFPLRKSADRLFLGIRIPFGVNH